MKEKMRHMDEMIKSLAARGAQIRAEEIKREIATLLAAFPDLTDQPVASPDPVARQDTAPQAPHWTQTPAGRAKLARAIKKSWKRRRADAVQS